MKRYTVLGLALVVGCFGACAGHAQSEAEESRHQMRQKVIDGFDRENISTTPGDAMMLRILVASSGAKRGIEVGSASGFGALNMGIAFERTGGHLWTLEIDPEAVVTCNENLKKAQLEDVVTCIEGDALKTLPALEGEFDFMFIDAAKPDYLKYLQAVEARLLPGAVIVADNVIQQARKMGDYLDYVQNSPDYETVIIQASEEKEDGMAISYKIR